MIAIPDMSTSSNVIACKHGPWSYILCAVQHSFQHSIYDVFYRARCSRFPTRPVSRPRTVNHEWSWNC